MWLKAVCLSVCLFLFLPEMPRVSVYHRILFVGNSLTITHVAPVLGWEGVWGMAASQADKDYAHQIQLLLAAQQGFAPEIGIISADLHRWDTVTPEIMFRGVTVAEFNPDLVIVQMGDNAPLDLPYAGYEVAYREAASWAPGARYLAMGKWGGRLGNVQEEYIEAAAVASGMQYIRIRDLHTEDAVAAQYTNTAVAWHPNDKGHAEIANRIVDVLAGVYLPTVGGCSGGTIPCEDNTMSDTTIMTRLGVNTTSPGQTLDVLGNAKIGDPTMGASLIIDGAAGTSRDLIWETNGVPRWAARSDSAAETGSNAGSNFLISARQDDGSPNSTALFIKRSNGYVGLGCTDPGTRLQVGEGPDAPYSGVLIYAAYPGTTRISARDTTHDVETIMGSIDGVSQIGSVTNHGVQILVNAAEVARFNTGGYFGIGTSTPAVKLTVETDGASGSIMNAAYGNSAEPSLILYGARGTQASPTATQADDLIGSIYFQGYATTRATGAKIYAQAAAGWGTGGDSTDAPASLHFATVPDGAGTLVERMVIQSDGSIGLRNMAPAPAANALVTIGDGDLYFDAGSIWLPVIGTGNPRAAVFAGASPLSVAFVASDPTAGMQQFDITVDSENGTYYQNFGGYTPHIFEAGDDELFRAYSITANDLNWHVLEVAQTLIVRGGETLPAGIWGGLPGSIAIVGENQISWHDQATGLYKFEIFPNKIYIYDDFIISDEEFDEMLWLQPEDRQLGLFINAAPQNPLHMNIYPITGGSQIGHFIVSGVRITGSGVYTFLDGTSGLSYVSSCVKGHAIVACTGAVVMVDLAVTTGASQVVTPTAGESITFSIVSNQLRVQRTAGSSNFNVILHALSY